MTSSYWLLGSLGTALAIATPAATPLFPPYGIDLSAQDRSVRPGDDFYQYENGAWLARTEIPVDLPSYTMGREELLRVEARLHQLIEDAAKGVAVQPESTDGKVGAMYAAFMDEKRIEALGVTPIKPQIAAVAEAPDRAALAGLMGQSPYAFGTPLFSTSIDTDLKDPSHYAVYLSQDGLGLPDRDYYLKPDFAAQRTAYKAYIQQLLALVGWHDPAGSAKAILELETTIADASWTKAEQRDLLKSYNPMTPAELVAFAPGFDWQPFLASEGLGRKTRLIVSEKNAFAKIAAIYASTPLETLKAQFAFSIADGSAPYLSAAFQRAHFAFRDKALSGQREMQARWKRAVTAVSGGECGGGPRDCFGTLDWAVGQLYVRHDFTPAAKAKMQKLVAELMAAYHHRIETLSWMSPATKQEALRKLETYTVKVGYPDHPRDYSKVAIRSDDLVGDVRRAARADWEFYLGRSDGPVDRSDWKMTPQTVDAYNGSLRDIVFPAAILQPSTFDPNADDAVNFGAIGALIGHEMTHGFDDAGRNIDAAGALRDWWAPADAAAFKARATQYGAQFAQFEPVPGMHINPDLTMGENIADLGGLVIAFDAYEHSLGGKTSPVLGGTTGEQRFFMSYAQDWRGKAREDSIRKKTASDPHSASRFRVLGPLPNIDAWYEAFGVKPGDKMYRTPDQRVRIW